MGRGGRPMKGRPTPHPGGFGERADGDRAAQVNPYLVAHRTFGPELLPVPGAQARRGAWAAEFGRDAPLHLEIGPGNGWWLTEIAARQPDVDFVAVEIRYKRTVLCARKVRRAGLKNVRIARYHAAYLHDLFEPGSLAAIWVNHPDPWPKIKQDKNRLVSRWFLEDVCVLLAPGGVLRIKSDFAPNVERVAELLTCGPDGEPLPALPLGITGQRSDVRINGTPWADDVVTTYQNRAYDLGLTVHAVELVRGDAPWTRVASGPAFDDTDGD